MNKSVLMIMGGALLVAILVAVVVQSKLSTKSGAGGATTEILVANKKLLLGERIKAEDVRWQAWPDASAFKGVIKKSEQGDPKKLDVYDTPLRRDIESGEPVTRQAIISDVKGAGNFLAATISPGMRAMAVAVKAETSAGGFVAPGDRVDVILSYTAKLNRDAQDMARNVVSRFASQTVLSNVRVLAVDQKSKDDGKEAKVAKTVTLEVTREGAEVLALAASMGDISVSLRRLGEKDKVEDMITPITTDATTSEVIRKLNDLVDQSAVTSNAVRVYSGSAVQNVPVRASGGQ